jgi:hypothetical protein
MIFNTDSSTLQNVASLATAAGVLVAVVALIISFHSETRARAHELERDRIARLKETRISFLRSAYSALSGAGAMMHIGADNAPAIAVALKDIQLLGTPRQVELADKFVTDFARDRQASFDPLLDELFKDLRDEAGLPPATRSNLTLVVLDGPSPEIDTRRGNRNPRRNS